MASIKKKITKQINRAQINLAPTKKDSPDELLGELFQDVQFRRIFPDGIIFVDMVPDRKIRRVLSEYKKRRHEPTFDLSSFVNDNFKEYASGQVDYVTNPNHTIEQHIHELWDVLTREVPKNKGSLIGLPYPYIVSGGRFIAQFYWDTYFTMLGLAVDDRWDMVENMVKNCAFLIRKVGFIPNGNRTYYTRSQPPVFALMVQLLAKKKPKTTLPKYLPYLVAEHNYWMSGWRKTSEKRPGYKHVVRMPDGSLLNRYCDAKSTPRPESYKEDIDTALKAEGRNPSKLYLDLRSAAESGWDFSSRWMTDHHNLATTHTTDIVPVDLNCLLVILEQTIADAYHRLKQHRLARYYREQAERRIAAIRNYCWDDERKFFMDYDFVAGKNTGVMSGAGAFALFADVATQAQADATADTLRKKFLQEGGLVTSLEETGQQWDWPNGWAPLQWVAIKGLRDYGHEFLAEEIKKRWIDCNVHLYKEQGKLVEKYNVVHTKNHAGGGEYVLQDGFGWTNGILLALLREEE